MIKRRNTLISLLLVLFIAVLSKSTPIRAAEGDYIYEPFVVVSTYRVTDDIIIPGQNFELVIEVENTDKKVATRDLLVTLNFTEGVSIAYGSSNQLVLNSLKPGEKKEITFYLYASPYYSRSSVAFGINFTSDIRTIGATVYAPVQLDLSAFKVVSQSIPEEAGAGEKIAASLSFKSLLAEKLSNVVLNVYVDNDSKPVTSINIGNISAGASKSQNVTFFINEKGRHSLKFELSYSMAEGDYSSTELYSGKIVITEPSGEAYSIDETTQEETMSERDKLIVSGCIGLSVLLSIGIVLIAKKYN